MTNFRPENRMLEYSYCFPKAKDFEVLVFMRTVATNITLTLPIPILFGPIIEWIRSRGAFKPNGLGILNLWGLIVLNLDNLESL